MQKLQELFLALEKIRNHFEHDLLASVRNHDLHEVAQCARHLFMYVSAKGCSQHLF